ncbi:MAG: M48 family metallopeptidase [Opitutaceae bacterium]
MDFFEAQARARKRTSRLLLLFGFAVAGTIAAAYFAAIGLLHYGRGMPEQRARYEGYTLRPHPLVLWQPAIFGFVSLGTIAVVGIASLYKWHQYSAGGSAVAESVGGRRIDLQTTNLNERKLLNVVEEMAIASGTPVPAVFVMDDEPAINAFAAGLTTSDAVVAVTRGTLEKLNRDELQGVVGHEFSHILNGDMRLNLRIAATVFGILVLGLAGRGILWNIRFARTRSRGKSSNNSILLAIIALGVALLIIGYVGYFFGRIIQAAVSRQREFLADASAVQFTRNPLGLTGALKKIGGYALGSTMQSEKSAAIGHFFFAQAFRRGFTGLWSTHPPLDERIRAIDPSFDGKVFEPPQVVDVTRESFVTAGLAPPQLTKAPAAGGHSFAERPFRRLQPSAAPSAVHAIGTLTPEQLENAHLFLETTPERLRAAAHAPHEAPIVVFSILLSADPAQRARQRNLVGTKSGPDALRTLDELEPALQRIRPEHKLPLLQIALPALRSIPMTAMDVFLETLDELVHADEHVSIFEFSLQKLLTHTLALGRTPASAVIQFHSFNAVADEISIVLSALARAATSDAGWAETAFIAGAAQLKLIETRLQFLPESGAGLVQLDAALDKLAAASPVIKQRTLLAAAKVVGADGQLLITEAELLRAIAAALDCPMPPLTPNGA